jgi:hypothetical protein
VVETAADAATRGSAAVEMAAVEATPAEAAAVAQVVADAEVPATPDVTVAAPEVAAELAENIAAPQYGVGLPLFDAQPVAVEPKRDDDAPKA